MPGMLCKRKRNETDEEQQQQQPSVTESSQGSNNFSKFSYQDQQPIEAETRESWRNSLDIDNLFKELSKAKDRLYPYQSFTRWNDERLWDMLICVLFPNSTEQLCPSPTELLSLVMEYQDSYEKGERHSYPYSIWQKMEVVFNESQRDLGPLESNLEVGLRNGMRPLKLD